jgi:hypothetical protein
MKSIVAIVITLAAALLTSGCATGYQPSDEAVNGGFSETRLAPDTWRVLVEGNVFSTRGEVEQFVMRRCAELTLEQGKRYFVLGGHDAWMRAERDGRSVLEKPANAAVFTALSERDRDAFDAIDVIKDTNAIAGGKLSSSAKRTLETMMSNAS